MQLQPRTRWCRKEPDLDVWVHIHESPFAVLAIDAERQLYLFVEQDAHFDSLFLDETVQSRSTPCTDSQQDRCDSLLEFSSRNVMENDKESLRLCV